MVAIVSTSLPNSGTLRKESNGGLGLDWSDLYAVAVGK